MNAFDEILFAVVGPIVRGYAEKNAVGIVPGPKGPQKTAYYSTEIRRIKKRGDHTVRGSMCTGAVFGLARCKRDLSVLL